jgi:hypothetical protein
MIDGWWLIAAIFFFRLTIVYDGYSEKLFNGFSAFLAFSYCLTVAIG